MKNFLILVLFFLITISCNRTVVEPVVIEPVLDQTDYYTRNMESIREYSRIELAGMPKDIQVRILNEYSASEKVALFKDKMQAILDQDIFTVEKANVINFVNNNLNEDIFTNNHSYANFLENLKKKL